MSTFTASFVFTDSLCVACMPSGDANGTHVSVAAIDASVAMFTSVVRSSYLTYTAVLPLLA
jgi:hypothetical protein